MDYEPILETKSERIRYLAADGYTPQQIRDLTSYSRQLIHQTLKRAGYLRVVTFTRTSPKTLPPTSIFISSD